MFKAILFDFDGTLVDFVAADTQSLLWLHSHIGAPVNFDAFLKTAVDEIMDFHHRVEELAIDPRLMHTYRLQNTLAHYDIPWDDEYVHLYRARLIETCVPFTGVEQLLVQVKQKTKTGLISNAYDAQEQRLRINHAGITHYFDVIVIACELGVYKPEPGIFWHALSQLDVSPGESLYIGDSVTHDIRGAKAAGMQAVHYSPTPRTVIGADYSVGNIAELQQLLAQLLN